jgi:hypothetical protein
VPLESNRGLNTDGEKSFGEAMTSLLRASLLNRDPETSTLSIHRLVQGVVVDYLNAHERTLYLERAVKMLDKAFPEFWGDDTDESTYKAWESCERCLPHVMKLSRQFANDTSTIDEKSRMTDLILRCSW